MDIQLTLGENGEGAFYIGTDEAQRAEMIISITGNTLTVYHTEVPEKASGKGLGHKLLTHMVAYARAHQMKVIPLCPYVLAQFKKHPDEYADVWKKNPVNE